MCTLQLSGIFCFTLFCVWHFISQLSGLMVWSSLLFCAEMERSFHPLLGSLSRRPHLRYGFLLNLMNLSIGVQLLVPSHFLWLQQVVVRKWNLEEERLVKVPSEEVSLVSFKHWCANGDTLRSLSHCVEKFIATNDAFQFWNTMHLTWMTSHHSLSIFNVISWLKELVPKTVLLLKILGVIVLSACSIS